MDPSLYLARAWGLFSVLLSAGILLNKKLFVDMVAHLPVDGFGIFIAGVIALAIGVAQVVVFNSWTLDRRGLVTLFGWLSLFKGIAIIFVPGYLGRFVQIFAHETWYTISLTLFFIMGAYLCYTGFAKRKTTGDSTVHSSVG